MKRYDAEGNRLTDCCGACSTYDEDGQLYCKECFEPVLPGEGDGTEKAPDVRQDRQIFPEGERQ